MRNRTTQRASGLVLQEADHRIIVWTYDSNILGPIRGELEYAGGVDNGWIITGLPPIPPANVTFWVIPLPLMEAVEKIEERLQMAEREAGKPSPEEERLTAELNELFDK